MPPALSLGLGTPWPPQFPPVVSSARTETLIQGKIKSENFIGAGSTILFEPIVNVFGEDLGVLPF